MTPISELGLDKQGGYAAANWVRAIARMNIRYVEDLEKLSDHELLRVRGMGRQSIHFIRERIAQHRRNAPLTSAPAAAQEIKREPGRRQAHRIVIRFDLR